MTQASITRRNFAITRKIQFSKKPEHNLDLDGESFVFFEILQKKVKKTVKNSENT
jgi:hypothetical protein